MAGPQEPAAARGDRLRAGRADRERVIETLKDAFVQDRLTKDELDTRTGLALTASSRVHRAERDWRLGGAKTFSQAVADRAGRR